MEIKRSGTENVCDIKEKQGVNYITFPKLEQTRAVSQLFSTRLGGISEGIFSSMNLSFSRGDVPEHVLENYRRIASILECQLDDIVCSDQTHTTNVRRVYKSDGGKGILREKDYHDIDGLITNEPGLVLATFYADCVPLYFVDPVHKAIGLSHSGWRGTVSEMGRHTIMAMQREFGSNPKEMLTAIGPSICQDCYEVSEDVIDAVKENFDSIFWPKLFYKKANEKYQLNLWECNKIIMIEAGIPENHIEVTDLCTCCNPLLLFSHRASHGKRGNLGAFLKLN